MNSREAAHGGRFKDIPYFNGGLFAEPARLELLKALWFYNAGLYNGLVTRRNRIDEAFAQRAVDAQFVAGAALSECVKISTCLPSAWLRLPATGFWQRSSNGGEEITGSSLAEAGFRRQ